MSKSRLSSHRAPRLWCSAVLGDFRSQMRVAPLLDLSRLKDHLETDRARMD